jgi:hypothetical protein
MRNISLFCVCLLTLYAASISGLINPNFTPIHLVEQSSFVCELRFTTPPKDGKAVANITRVFKGKAKGKTVTVNLSAGIKAHAEAVEKMLKSSKDEGILLFVGEYLQEEAEEILKLGYLCIGGQWVSLVGGEKNVWNLGKIDEKMQATWAGSTDMLTRCVEYILKDPDAEVPVKTFAEWSGNGEKAGKIQGKVSGACAVDIDGNGQHLLFITSDKGDHLLKYNKEEKAFQDVTQSYKLASASLRYVWGDFNGDGRLDLVSWSGTAMIVHQQGSDRAFAARSMKPPVGNGECLSLSLIDTDLKTRGSSAVLIGTKTVPVIWHPATGIALPLEKLDTKGKDYGKPNKCLVADFDGDYIQDIIQLFEKNGIFYKGSNPGRFNPPIACGISVGPGEANAYTGDYDADGLLDVLTLAEDRNRVWQNTGKASFVEMLGLSGEIAYISRQGGIDGMTGDVNNDGRQDVLLIYSDESPQLFFNRGFRSFGHSHMLDLAEKRLCTAAEKGQQAGCLGDLNDDGAQDMAIVLKDGEVWVFLRDTGFEPALSIRVSLPRNGLYAGPITVMGYSGDRCLGAWNVDSGTAEAFFGQDEAGPCRIEWRMPGGSLQKKEIVLEEKPVKFIIGKK